MTVICNKCSRECKVIEVRIFSESYKTFISFKYECSNCKIVNEEYIPLRVNI